MGCTFGDRWLRPGTKLAEHQPGWRGWLRRLFRRPGVLTVADIHEVRRLLAAPTIAEARLAWEHHERDSKECAKLAALVPEDDGPAESYTIPVQYVESISEGPWGLICRPEDEAMAKRIVAAEDEDRDG